MVREASFKMTIMWMTLLMMKMSDQGKQEEQEGAKEPPSLDKNNEKDFAWRRKQRICCWRF